MGDPVDLSTLTSHLICKLCTGYLIEATTIIECLHTFCKSCIVKYLEDENHCPECREQIHQSHPLSYVMLDRQLQDIVYKAVPGLQAKEEQRIRDFYKQRNLPVPEHESKSFKTVVAPEENGVETEIEEPEEKSAEKGTDCNYHRDDTQVSIKMEAGDKLPDLKKRFLKCSISTTIKTLKRYVSQLLYTTPDRHDALDIFCQKELMGKDHSLEFVLCTRWRTKNLPLVLEYRERVDVT